MIKQFDEWKLNEGWFKSNIDKAQDEPLTNDKIDSYKSEIDDLRYRLGSALTAYFVYKDIQKKRSKYFDRVIYLHHELSMKLYILCKLLRKYPEEIGRRIEQEWYNEIIEYTFSKFHGTGINDYNNSSLVKLMLEVEFFLNRINFLVNRHRQLRFIHEIAKQNYGKYYRFIDRNEDDGDEDDEIGPFDDKDWGDNEDE